MIGGAPPEIDIYCARESVIGQFNRLKHALSQETDDGIVRRAYCDGKMMILSHQLDKELGRFGVEMGDG